MGYVVSLKGCKFEYTKMSIHFESMNQSFNDECAIVKEAQEANLLSQESKLTRANLQLIWCPLKSTTPVKVNLQRHTTSWSDYDMQ